MRKYTAPLLLSSSFLFLLALPLLPLYLMTHLFISSFFSAAAAAAATCWLPLLLLLRCFLTLSSFLIIFSFQLMKMSSEGAVNCVAPA